MLPQTFAFSQSSLQDYADCPRRFQLRYIVAQAWPGVQAEPVTEYERHMERGVRFHRLVERHQLGMDAARLAASIDDPDLLTWWQAYLGFVMLHQLEGRRYPEFTLSTDLAGVRLSATFDLLVVSGERIVVFDWKTSRRRLARQWFETRLQTRVYRYVVARAGAALAGREVQPEQVSMVYWVTGMPDEPVMLDYDARFFAQDGVYLKSVVGEILGREAGSVWALTSDERRCRFCEYRSLCGREAVVGDYEEFDMSLDNIALGEVGFLGLDDVLEVGF